MSVGLCSAFAPGGNLSEDNWKENRFCRWTGVQMGRGVGGNRWGIWKEKVKGETAGIGRTLAGQWENSLSLEIIWEVLIFKKKTVNLHLLKVSVNCRL